MRCLDSSSQGSHNEKMRRHTIIVAGIAALALLMFSGIYAATSDTGTNSELRKRLVQCGSIPNGASLTVVQTTRLFIFLPKDYYPNIKLSMTYHGAFAGSVSNAGAYGYAQSRDARPDCWSYYLDFELAPNNKTQSGTIDIGSKSAFRNVSNYLSHFKVVVNPPDATKPIVGNGNVHGQVFLGPVCPVERIPPDPACAPKPYKTAIDIWSTLTGSSYKRVTTNASGVFNLSLSPGPYGLKVSQMMNGSPYPRCTEVKILVATKKSQNVTLNCDTGIR